MMGGYKVRAGLFVFALTLWVACGLVGAQEPLEVEVKDVEPPDVETMGGAEPDVREPDVREPDIEGRGVEVRPVESQVALSEGNQLFFDGQMEAAVAAYVAGYSPARPHSTLAYNLGAVHHHLGRLPEAILWYRRAGEVADPWLEENLWLARRSLNSRPLPPSGPLGFLTLHADTLRWCGVGLAWLGVAFAWAASRLSFRVLMVLFVLSGTVYAVPFAVELWGPRPAVLLQACQGEDAELPAGTEAWIRAAGGDHVQVLGLSVTCPSSAVALVSP